MCGWSFTLLLLVSLVVSFCLLLSMCLSCKHFVCWRLPCLSSFLCLDGSLCSHFFICLLTSVSSLPPCPPLLRGLASPRVFGSCLLSTLSFVCCLLYSVSCLCYGLCAVPCVRYLLPVVSFVCHTPPQSVSSISCVSSVDI